MSMLRRILFPVDFSACALKAMPHAFQWAQREGASLDVLYVLTGDDHALPEPVFEVLRRRAYHEIQCLFDSHGAEHLTGLHRVVQSSSPARAIVDFARERDSDLIVMGTHARAPAGMRFHGGVTDQVLSEAPCPVLAIPASGKPLAAGGLARVLVPVDFSPASAAAVRRGTQIAAHDDGTVILLHVVEDFVLPDVDLAIGDRIFLHGLERRSRAEAELERLFAEAGASEVPHEAVVAHGRAASEIAGFAGRTRADLIVMSIHGRSAQNRLLAGSVTEKVLHRAPCPVLALPGETSPARAESGRANRPARADA